MKIHQINSCLQWEPGTAKASYNFEQLLTFPSPFSKGHFLDPVIPSYMQSEEWKTNCSLQIFQQNIKKMSVVKKKKKQNH